MLTYPNKAPKNKEHIQDETSTQEGKALPYPGKYFTNGKLDNKKIPPYLKGLALDDPTKINITPEQVCQFIDTCCIGPGREKLFTTENIPGRAKDFEATVELTDYTPWQEHLRSCSPADKLELEKIIYQLKQNDLICDSTPPYAKRCLLIRKKDGRNKIALSLNTLNKRVVKNTYPLPLIKDMLDCLSGSKYFSLIDVCSAYHSIPIKKEHQKYFAFITHIGLFMWKRLPYGFRNAGAIFCHLMDKLLAGLKWVILCVYCDDILVFAGETFEEHLAALNKTFDRLKAGGLTLSIAKCSLFQRFL